MTRQRGTWLQTYLLPGLIFQSVVVSGGYGTGAELTEYFLPYGVAGGLLSLALVTFPLWAVVCAITFELARLLRAYDYRALMRPLLGRGWRIYDGAYLLSLVISLAVISAAAGSGVQSLTGAPYPVGILLIGGCITALVLRGSVAVERFLSLWSYVLYGVYLLFLLRCFAELGGCSVQLTCPEVLPGWAGGGAKYAFYNLGIIPAVLGSLRHIRTRRQAVLAGIIAAAVATLPAMLLLAALGGLYPGILQAEVPVEAVFAALRAPLLHLAFQITLLGTLVETGAGLIRAAADRMENGKKAGHMTRPAVTVGLVALGAALSGAGLGKLVQQGYGALAWVFLAVYAVPLLTVGLRYISTAGRGRSAAAKAASGCRYPAKSPAGSDLRPSPAPPAPRR